MAKTIVICSDGTWNDPEQRDHGVYCPSNVVKMARAVAPQNKANEPQVVFYDPGVGTDGKVMRWIEGATGLGLSKNVKDDYTFLINNYQPGDRVFCFGFSRGAFTVRSLGGLIGKVGLLKKPYWPHYHRAYDLYRNSKLAAGSPEIADFRKQYCHSDSSVDSQEPPVIHFMGVWDTVGSLGIPLTGLRRFTSRKYSFHNVTLSTHTPYAYQALAIDEKRGAFIPSIWQKSSSANNQAVEQVWFAGVHTNIGGGYQDGGLSDIALAWMMEKASACGLDLETTNQEEGLKENHRGDLRESRKGFYKLLFKHLRPIGRGNAAQEAVHGSALLRRDEPVNHYAPPNLPPNAGETMPVVPYTPPEERN